VTQVVYCEHPGPLPAEATEDRATSAKKINKGRNMEISVTVLEALVTEPATVP